MDARHRQRPHAGSDAARPRRRDVHAEPRRHIMAIDAKTGDVIWEYQRKLPEGVNGGTNRNMAMWGNLIIDASADNIIYALDAQTGKLAWETPILESEAARQRQRRADHRQRQGHHRPSVPARRQQRLVHHHRARRADGQGALAHLHDPASGRAGRRNVGRRADGRALARRHVDGAELRPGAEPDLRRHVGDDPGAEVHARRQRQAAPLSQLHAGARRRHRQDRLVLPARRRSLGSRSSVRAHARRHRGRARPEGGRVDQSEDQAGRDGARSSPAFPARPASSTRSIARPANSSGRGRRCCRTS